MPAVVVALILVAAAIGQAGADLAGLTVDPTVLTVLLVVNVLLAAYHVAAIVDAWLLGIRRSAPHRPGPAATIALVVIVAATVGLHGYVEYVGIEANTTLDAIFEPGGDDEPGEAVIPPAVFDDDASAGPDDAESSSSPSSTTPGGSLPADPSVSPDPTASAPASASASPSPAAASSPAPTRAPGPAWAADGRLNLLLVGADSGPDRWSLRTDTMILLSVSTETGRAALFGIPRNLVGVPLAPESANAFPDGRFPRLLNALYVYAMGHPAKFPGGENRGYRAVAGAVQQLVGVPLDGMVVVNLAGFVQLIDELGGLWIDIEEPLYDDNYPLEDGSGHITIDFSRGCQHLGGRMALAYARSRHQDSDYGRMRRQQAVLLALARNVDPVELVPRAPRLFKIARDNLWTTLRRADLRGLAELAGRVKLRRIVAVRFTPPDYPAHLDKAAVARIRAVVRGAFEGPMPPQAPLPSGQDCR